MSARRAPRALTPCEVNAILGVTADGTAVRHDPFAAWLASGLPSTALPLFVREPDAAGSDVWRRGRPRD